MRGFLAFVMYAGGVIAVIAFALPFLADRGIEHGISEEVRQIMTWGSLAMVVLGFIGREMSRSES